MRRTSALIGSLLFVAGCPGPTNTGMDVGPTDTGVTDAGPRDTGIPDTGTPDTGMADTGTTDTGTDAGPVGPDFQVTSFGTTNCTTIDQDTLIGDDRGGIAVASDHVFLTADDGSAGWDLELASGSRLGTPVLSATTGDNLVADVLTGQLYILGGDVGPLGPSGGTPEVPNRISRLLVGLDDASEGATEVVLSTPIEFTPVQTESDIGIFAGAGEVGIHNGTNLYVIHLTTGIVTDLGPVPLPPHTLCENWAYWGVLERVAGTYSVVLAQDQHTIVRVNATSGVVSTVLSLPPPPSPAPENRGIADMCSFGASVSNNRWYFHHEVNSDLAPDITEEALGYCDATFVTAGGDFAIGSLGTTCTAIDVLATIGDDRGGLAVAPPYVFLVGDRSLGRFDLDLTGAVGNDVPILDALVTDLHTATIWSLADDTALLSNFESALEGTPAMITRLVQLDASGLETTTEITLSTPIALDGSAVGLFSGWDELLIHDGSHVFRIALPSGTVTDLGAMATPEHTSCENWAYWGIAERIGGQSYLVAVNDTAPSIDRFRVPDGERTAISTFTNLSDMCSISLSTMLDRWYFHHEGESQLTSGPWSETLGFCDATIVHP